MHKINNYNTLLIFDENHKNSNIKNKYIGNLTTKNTSPYSNRHDIDIAIGKNINEI